MKDTFYVRLQNGKPAMPSGRFFAATEDCPWRGRVIRSEVHDENAWACGGVAAHAGVFSAASDLGKLCGVLLDCRYGRGDFIRQDTIARFWRPGQGPAGSVRRLGWDGPSPVGSSAGRRFNASSVGHTGFTGTSLWIDVEREIVVILLANRVHPTRDNLKIKAFRPQFHDTVMEVLL